ncbi:MAG: DUF4124 domain-containing protein [Nitrospiria bacterium]
MFPNIKRFAVPSLLLIFLSASAYPMTPVYMWKDSNGVSNFGDDPAGAPAGAKVTVLPENSNFQNVSETVLTNMETNGAQDPPPLAVTQGAFAVQLVKELGLRKDASPREAAGILSSVRIAPPLGRWFLSQPMTPELTARLRQLSVAAAKEGWIKIPENQALLAFDTSAAVLGLNISVSEPPPRESPYEEEPSVSPAAASPVETPPIQPNNDISPAEEEQSMPAENAPDVIYSAYPILAAPPLISFITPLPAFYPYYSWYPVSGGFWCNNYFYPGYYVLNTNQFFYNNFGYNYNDRRFIGLNPGAIGGQVQGRIINSQFQSLPQTRPNLSGLRSMPGRRILNSPSIPLRSSVNSGPRTGSIRSQNTYFSPRLMNKPAVRLQPQSINRRMKSFRPSYKSPPVYHRYASSSLGPRSLSSPVSHGIFSNSSRRSFSPSNSPSYNGFSHR